VDGEGLCELTNLTSMERIPWILAVSRFATQHNVHVSASKISDRETSTIQHHLNHEPISTSTHDIPRHQDDVALRHRTHRNNTIVSAKLSMLSPELVSQNYRIKSFSPHTDSWSEDT
jgi:hypothetical protein